MTCLVFVLPFIQLFFYLPRSKKQGHLHIANDLVFWAEADKRKAEERAEQTLGCKVDPLTSGAPWATCYSAK